MFLHHTQSILFQPDVSSHTSNFIVSTTTKNLKHLLVTFWCLLFAMFLNLYLWIPVKADHKILRRKLKLNNFNILWRKICLNLEFCPSRVLIWNCYFLVAKFATIWCLVFRHGFIFIVSALSSAKICQVFNQVPGASPSVLVSSVWSVTWNEN